MVALGGRGVVSSKKLSFNSYASLPLGRTCMYRVSVNGYEILSK